MPDRWIEKDRFLALQTSLGDDKFLLRSFTGHEGISRLFSFELDMLSEDQAVDFNDMIGQNVTFGVSLISSGQMRYFNGYVSRFAQLPGEERLTNYRATVVPWLWFLTRTANCRIFQKQSAMDIITSVFQEYGRNFLDQTSGSLVREYCVQYRETSFNFVSRLMEEEGIFYYFQHENGKHTLVLANSQTEHKPCPMVAKVRFETSVGSGTFHEDDTILRWRMDQELRTGKYALTDFNFQTPNTNLNTNVNSVVSQGGNEQFETFDFPGKYEKKSDGEGLAKVRMEEEEARHTVIRGEGSCSAFVSGYKFEFTGHPRRDQNGSYTLTSVNHRAQEGGLYSGAGSETEASYSNSFSAIPNAVPFRPVRRTKRPVVRGTQTAVVVGPSGEEIYADKYGRVKVHFPWDRYGQKNENSSCWIRVSQLGAGKNWGAMWLPRIGQEVIVDFLEGDPDRPIITGRVYNADQMPPYPLPDDKTKSTFKSYSSKGGGGANEIRFEDKKGSEQLYIHAQKDYDSRTENDVTETIGNERHLTIGKDQFEEVKGDQHLKVKGDKNEKVDGTASLKVGGDLQEKVGQNYALDAGTAIHLKAGMTLVIESGTALTLKVGGNFISLNPGGVFISGTMVMINSGGAASSGAGSSPQTPKPPRQIDAAALGKATELAPAAAPPKQATYSPAAAVLKHAARSGAPFCDI